MFNQQQKVPSTPSHPQWDWQSITVQISTATGWATQPRVYDEPFHHVASLKEKNKINLLSLQKLHFILSKTLYHVSGTEQFFLSITMLTQFSSIITQENHHVPFPHADRLASAAQRRRLEVPPASSFPAQKLCVGKEVSVWSVTEKSPGETLFYRIELKHLTLLYNGIIIVLLSEFQRSSVEWPFLKYFSLILSDLNFL